MSRSPQPTTASAPKQSRSGWKRRWNRPRLPLTAREAEIETLNAQLADSRTKAADAAAQEAELEAQIAAKSEELNRLAEGDDAFLARQRELSDQLSAKRLEQLTRQKDAELAEAQIAALEQRTKDAAARRASLEESLSALAARSESCRAEIEAIRKAKSESTGKIAEKEAAIRKATEERLLHQKKRDRGAGQRPARRRMTARRWAGRWPALPSGKPQPKASTMPPPQSSGMNTSSPFHRRKKSVWSSTASLRCGRRWSRCGIRSAPSAT